MSNEREGLIGDLVVFLANIGAQRPNDHPWAVEARRLADRVKNLALLTQAQPYNARDELDALAKAPPDGALEGVIGFDIHEAIWGPLGEDEAVRPEAWKAAEAVMDILRARASAPEEKLLADVAGRMKAYGYDAETLRVLTEHIFGGAEIPMPASAPEEEREAACTCVPQTTWHYERDCPLHGEEQG